MDKRVIRALELLKEAGRLDLIAAPAAPRERPVRRAASGVAAAVAACSPLREPTQVSRAGRGRNGRLALSHKGRVTVSLRTQLRPLGAWRLRGSVSGGVGGGAGTSSAFRPRRQQGQPVVMAGAQAGGGQDDVHTGDAGGAGRQVSKKVSKGNGHASLPVAGVTDGERLGGSPGGMMGGGGEQQPWGQGQSTTSGEEGLVGQLEGLGGGERETVMELSHILEWSDESDQGGGEVRDLEVKEDGLVFKGGQCGSEDGDPGEPLAGSEPWEEEEVTAGPSTASWTGYHCGGKAVRAKEVVKQYTTGPGFAPPSGRVRGGFMYCRLEQVQAETENGHMTDVNGWEEKKTRQMLIGKEWTVAGIPR
ncbi:hypothetical protein NDU88_003753 [Pleurodeles waltl]|uniref:Uncharacterized protein n=1 Tax=Pleurodeles waltl TaxID=8319 RepID=A0AAV7SGT9_PLEWA|nr:hypothetical protein NDU88_003753 [Pleurodeles waltl]